MSYEWTSEACPVCGEDAEYNCVDEVVFCQACHSKEQALKDTLGTQEYNKIRAKAELEALLKKKAEKR